MNTRKNTKGPGYFVQMAKGSTGAAQPGEDLPSKGGPPHPKTDLTAKDDGKQIDQD